MGHIQTSKLIPASVADVYAYVTQIENAIYDLEPHIRFEVSSDVENRVREATLRGEKNYLEETSEIEVSLCRFGMKSHVRIEVTELRAPNIFTYRQLEGSVFKCWTHRQTLREHGESTTLLHDFVDFKMKMGFLGSLVDDLIVRRDIERILNARLARIETYFLRRRELGSEVVGVSRDK